MSVKQMATRKTNRTFLGVGADGIALVGFLNEVTTSLVRLGILLCIRNHVLNILVTKTRRGGNGHGLILVGGLILSRYVDNTISINVKGNLDLRNTLRSRRNTDKVEVAKELVVPDQLTLALVDLDLNGRLAVSGSGEDL